MKKQSKDKQLAEFSKKDLGHDIQHSKSAIKVMPKSKLTSILLPELLIEKLRDKAEHRGIGYQTMLKIILTEKVDQY